MVLRNQGTPTFFATMADLGALAVQLVVARTLEELGVARMLVAVTMSFAASFLFTVAYATYAPAAAMLIQ